MILLTLSYQNILTRKTAIGDKPYERKLKCKDGSFKWIEWRDSIANNNTFVSVGIDISDWKKTEEIKIQSANIINSVESIIFVSNKEGQVLFASPSVEKTLGYTFEEISGDEWWEVTYDNENETYSVDDNDDRAFDYTFGNPDFSFIQFRSNLVLRWEYVPGSELFLVWSQGANASGDPNRGLTRSLSDNLFGENARNVFLVKATYRFLR